MANDERAAPRTPRVGRLLLVAALLWFGCGFWNSVKPMPAGTHLAGLPARLTEAQVEFIDDSNHRGVLLQHELLAVDRAAELIVLDQCPLPPEIAAHLLARKRAHPNLKIVLNTDPRGELYGGTSAVTLATLERAGIIVARTRLERLRDSNPVYSSLWRLTVSWWSDATAGIPGVESVDARLRSRNGAANQRQLLVADDGAGGWSSLIAAAPVAEQSNALGNVGLEIRGRLARDLSTSELQIAAWSADDDRLPSPPSMANDGVGSIDARALTEGAIRTGLLEVIATAGDGDVLQMTVPNFGHRSVMAEVARAARRGARIQLLLDSTLPANRAAAAEVIRDGGAHVAVRWTSVTSARLLLLRHGTDVWLTLGSADYVRRSLDDLDLQLDIELHMPARSAPARGAAAMFAREWTKGVEYGAHADESRALYWRYRVAELTGFATGVGTGVALF